MLTRQLLAHDQPPVMIRRKARRRVRVVLRMRLKREGGAVLYHRDNPDEPHSNAMPIIQLVTRNKRPIRLGAELGFSE